MTAVSRPEAAARAGVDAAYVDRLVELGILVPVDGQLTDVDVRRIAIVRELDTAGLGVGSIAEAIRSGVISLGFVEAPTFERYVSITDETLGLLGQRTGIPFDLLVVVRQALGSRRPTSADRVREDELRVFPLIAFMLDKGFRHEAIERWIQVYGESLRKVAETEEDYFQTEVMEPHLERGLSYGEALNASVEWSPQLGALANDALQAIYRAQQARSWTRGIIKYLEAELIASGLHTRLDRPPAIAFLDIAGYTRLTEERGDVAAAELAERLARLVQRASGHHGGQPVKWLGDGVMFYFPVPASAVLASLEMVEGVSIAGLPPAHVGIHAGPVLFQEGDYFGRTVNIASRIGSYARAGEVLVSRDVVDGSPADEVGYTSIGPVELKGVAEAIELYSARRVGHAGG
jgi:class 3 adenylate cyclase